MLACKNCGAVFEEPVKGYEEEKDCCPNCGDWDITEAVRCSGCGEWSAEKTCENCKDGVRDAVKGLIRLYVDVLKLTPDEVTDIIEDSLTYGSTVTISAERLGC